MPKHQTVEEGFQEFVAAAYEGAEVSEEQKQAARDVWMSAVMWVLSDQARKMQDQRPPATKREARERVRARDHRLGLIALEVGAYATERAKSES